MKPAFPVFLALSTVWPALASSSGKAQTPPADTAPAVQLPSVTVTAKKDKANPIFGGNPLFDHTFADLAGGPLIEAIFWRHRFLTRHPQEDAVILTTVRGNRLVSATTLYSQGGKIYASSNALGEKVSVPGLVPLDLHRAAGLAQATKFIGELRQQILLNRPVPPEIIPVGYTILQAEESGGYGALRPAQTTPGGMMALDAETIVPAVDFSGTAPRPSSDGPTASEGEPTGSMDAALAEKDRQHALTNAAVQAGELQDFKQSSDSLVNETYAGLHDPAHAGLVPVALGETNYRKARVPCVVFDWDGVQYTYQPDRGTTARALPRNPFTGLPYLCLKNGALAECVYFCATYSQKFPAQKAVVVPGDPSLVAFQTEENLGLFFPKLGYFTLAKGYRGAVDNPEALEKVRTRIVALQNQPGATPDATPEQMPGDDGDLQMRRAFLACQAAGLVCHLHEEGPPWFDFARDGLTYVYGSDQKIHAPNLPDAGARVVAAEQPDFKVPAIQPVQLTGPAIPDHELEIPDLGEAPPGGSAAAPRTAATGEVPPSTARDHIVMMPPLVVATTRIAKNPWRYARVQGFEVLTRASDGDSRWDLDGLRHGLWIQQAIIPREWLPELPVPCTVIIDDTDLATIRKDQPHSQALEFGAPSDPLAWGPLSGQIDDAVEPVSSDGDTFAINTNLHDVDTRGVTYGSINLDRLRRSTPPLPEWAISGLLGRDGIFREGFLISAGDMGQLNEAAGPGTLWISPEETERLLQLLAKDKKARIALLPLAEFFAETSPSEENRAIWESEAGLFLRWGLMGPGHDNRALSQGFLTLVRRARREPVTEQLFTECFGFGYQAMEDKLGAFLKVALAKPIRVRDLKMPSRFGPPKIETATPDETGRILGDWIRMQGEDLSRQKSPAAPDYFNAAGQMLWRAYRDDNALPDQSSADTVSVSQIRDARLLAVYGLYEHDAGRDDKAREFLDAAVRADVVRPRAYQVLGELCFAQAVAQPLGTNGKISGPQAATILEPLKKALRFPASFDLYNLMVNTWGRCDARPDSGEVETLVAGANLFPRSTALAFKTALVCARNGYRGQAGELVRQGLLFATDAGDRNRFERLRSILENSPTTGVK